MHCKQTNYYYTEWVEIFSRFSPSYNCQYLFDAFVCSGNYRCTSTRSCSTTTTLSETTFVFGIRKIFPRNLRKFGEKLFHCLYVIFSSDAHSPRLPTTISLLDFLTNLPLSVAWIGWKFMHNVPTYLLLTFHSYLPIIFTHFVVITNREFSQKFSKGRYF